MSTPISPKFDDQPQVYRKPRADVFTTLLVIALLAILLATAMLWMVMGTYEYKFKGGPPATWNESAPSAKVAGTRRVPSAGYGTRSVPTTLHLGTDAPSPV